MPTRLGLLVIVIASIVSPQIRADSTDCATPVLMIADGRITQSSFSQGATYWYAIQAQAGHSYSVEFEPPADNYPNATRVQFTTLGLFGPTDPLQACRGTSSVAVTQNSGYAPVILKNGYGAGRRVSFTAQSAGLHLISATNQGGAGNYTFRSVDTTMVNVLWSTCGGFDNEWMFQNISDMPITGVLTVYDFSNHALTAAQTSIPPGAGVVRYSHNFEINLPRNSAGYAIFSHNGPPNSIVAISYMVNGALTVIAPARFESAVPH